MEFEADAIEWRGPAPFVFVPVPLDLSAQIRSISKFATYRWGCIPVVVRVGSTEFKTSLFPKGEVYLTPMKMVVQRAEGVKICDRVSVWMEVVARAG